jgi:hypothetical protein
VGLSVEPPSIVEPGVRVLELCARRPVRRGSVKAGLPIISEKKKKITVAGNVPIRL